MALSAASGAVTEHTAGLWRCVLQIRGLEGVFISMNGGRGVAIPTRMALDEGMVLLCCSTQVTVQRKRKQAEAT